MILGWVMLVPTAVTSSLCRRYLPEELLFTIHSFLNLTAFSSVSSALVLLTWRGGNHRMPHADRIFCQALYALVRKRARERRRIGLNAINRSRRLTFLIEPAARLGVAH